MNISWDAAKYTRDFSFVHQYGSSLLDWIEGENLSVLDLGCGNGALARAFEARGRGGSAGRFVSQGKLVRGLCPPAVQGRQAAGLTA